MPDRSETNYADVHAFHTHFGLPAPKVPVMLDEDVFLFRRRFMQEELHEFNAAFYDHEQARTNEERLAEMADALIDLVYVAMGTAVMMGLPWQLLWDEVQQKNMEKVKVESAADSKRGHAFDIKKPAGWTPPDIAGLLKAFTDRMHYRPEPQYATDAEIEGTETGRFQTEGNLTEVDLVAEVNAARNAGEDDPYSYVAAKFNLARWDVKNLYYRRVFGGSHR